MRDNFFTLRLKTLDRVQILKKNFVPTKGAEDWRSLLAKPEVHWKNGRSAKVLAYLWEEKPNDFPKRVKKLFMDSDIDIFKKIELLLALPEYKVPLRGRGRQSQNDIFVLAKTGKDLISIVIEGKVNEGFDDFVSDWLKSASPNKIERFRFLYEQFGFNEDDVQGIRYQLLHRTVSALLQAKNFNASIALMLVHSFSEKLDGFTDYSKFASLFGITVNPNKIHFAKKIDDINLYLAWVTDSIRI